MQTIADVFDGRFKQTLVVGELLEGTHAAGGAQDCHEVVRLNVLVYESLQSLANIDGVLKGEVQIVYYDGDRAMDLLGPQLYRLDVRQAGGD